MMPSDDVLDAATVGLVGLGGGGSHQGQQLAQKLIAEIRTDRQPSAKLVEIRTSEEIEV
jgi:hypothetical protein